MEDSNFTVTDVVPFYAQSQNIGDNRRSAVGIARAFVSCKLCSASWTATKAREAAPGKLVSRMSDIVLVCPHCGETGSLPMRPLLRVSETPTLRMVDRRPKVG